jgi:hypothetical protein
MLDIDKTLDEMENEVIFETPGYYGNEFEFEDDEVESLAADLLAIQNDDELEEWLGSVFKKIKKGASNFVRSPLFSKVKGFVRSAAKKAIPMAGRALGTYFGGPAGGALGGKVGSYFSSLFEGEFEGMSYEDAEFEAAKKFTRFAMGAMSNAAQMPANLDSKEATKQAILNAANRYAPSLVGSGRSSAKSGRWIRKGNQVVLLGL